MKCLRKIMLWLAAIGLVLPQVTSVSAASPSGQAQNAATITDVALTSDGLLRGQLVNREGNPKAKVAVTLSAKDQVVGQGVTDQQGFFAVKVAKGGVYTLSDGQTMTVLRVWTNGAAPPSAKSGILMVSDQELVRGQDECCEPCQPHHGRLLGWAAVIGIAAGIAIAATTSHNAS